MYGQKINIFTDHKPIVGLRMSPEKSARVNRQLEYIYNFNVKINYIKGEENKLADWLSRININDDKEELIAYFLVYYQHPFHNPSSGILLNF